MYYSAGVKQPTPEFWRRKAKPKAEILACCPGYVNTDMSSGRGTKTPLQGADTPAWLALLAPKGTTGKFFSSRKEEPF